MNAVLYNVHSCDVESPLPEGKSGCAGHESCTGPVWNVCWLLPLVSPCLCRKAWLSVSRNEHCLCSALSKITPRCSTGKWFRLFPQEHLLKKLGNCCRNSHRTYFLWGFPTLSSLAQAQAVPSEEQRSWSSCSLASWDSVAAAALCGAVSSGKRASHGACQVGKWAHTGYAEVTHGS